MESRNEKKSEKIGFSSVLHERRDTISNKVTTYIFHDSVFFFFRNLLYVAHEHMLVYLCPLFERTRTNN